MREDISMTLDTWHTKFMLTHDLNNGSRRTYRFMISACEINCEFFNLLLKNIKRRGSDLQSTFSIIKCLSLVPMFPIEINFTKRFPCQLLFELLFQQK